MRSLEPRERRTIAIGATIAIVALATAFVGAPAVRRWREREEAIALSRARVERLRGLAGQGSTVVAAAAQHEASAVALPVRLLQGRTSALAASELQRVLQEQARLSRVTVNRLDVADASTAPDDAGLAYVPATISAVTDIYGLADLLSRLQRGSPLLQVHEVGVIATSVLRGGEMLQVTLSVRAPIQAAP